MAVLYRHIRLDTNEPFYIGIGRQRRRAYTTSGRSKEWRDIYNKTPIEVEILCEHDDWQFLCDKEKEFILLYGRIDLGTGMLVNKTAGGSSGNLNMVITDQRRQSLRVAAKCRFANIEERTKISNTLKGRFTGIENPFYGKTHTDENKRKFSRKGATHSTHTKKMMSETRVGSKNHFYGKTHSDDTLEKMKRYHNNRSESTLKKMSESQKNLRWVKRDGECLRIHSHELKQYIDNGWERGMIRKNTKHTGEIYD